MQINNNRFVQSLLSNQRLEIDAIAQLSLDVQQREAAQAADSAARIIGSESDGPGNQGSGLTPASVIFIAGASEPALLAVDSFWPGSVS